MEPADKDIQPPMAIPARPARGAGRGTIPKGVRFLPADLDLIDRAAAVIAERERLPNVTAADIIRRGALKEADAILDGQAA